MASPNTFEVLGARDVPRVVGRDSVYHLNLFDLSSVLPRGGDGSGHKLAECSTCGVRGVA
jgi:hypothetical protein